MPNAARAVVEDAKLNGYLLDVEHMAGGPKAVFFLQFGFTPEQPDRFRSALLTHAVDGNVLEVRQTRFGVIYRLRYAMPTPDGRSPSVISAWEVAFFDDRPRLVTAFPG